MGAEAIPILTGRVDSVRLDLAHQDAGAVEEIAGAYRAAIDLLLDTGRPEDPLPEVARAREAHRRHAPAGSFEGHLFRGARALDGEE